MRSVAFVGRGGSRKLVWKGHIGLESPKTTKGRAEDVEGRCLGRGFISPQSIRGFGERRRPKLSQRGLGIFGHYMRNFVRFHACFSAF